MTTPSRNERTGDGNVIGQECPIAAGAALRACARRPAQLYGCDGSNAQQWTMASDGTVRALGKCLDATGASAADGTRLQIWSCTGGGNQKWTVSTG